MTLNIEAVTISADAKHDPSAAGDTIRTLRKENEQLTADKERVEGELTQVRQQIGAAIKGASARAGGWPKNTEHGYAGENAEIWLHGWQWCHDCLNEPEFIQPGSPLKLAGELVEAGRLALEAWADWCRRTPENAGKDPLETIIVDDGTPERPHLCCDVCCMSESVSQEDAPRKHPWHADDCPVYLTASALSRIQASEQNTNEKGK